ncbi:Alpha/Beta hydrolase protein [Leucosporidium creatinivorum]|uniref:acylaminoacyl-peptidase n=1 Tax=Leucosporidium creatinivorum TaxID=106004 RepID=A0A1Y2FWI0_9BASI|nr:Alpha/Beta hydrolase protein [Leucosporidium creatinivorum]
MTSHTSLQMPSPSPKRVPPPQRPTANNVDAAIQHFNSLLEHPTVTRATFLPSTSGDSNNTLLLDTSQRSISALIKRSATQTLGLTDDGAVAFSSPLAFTSPEVQHTSFSPDGKLQAVFRNISAKEGKGAKRVIEVLSVQDGLKLEELDVTEEHGDWYFDATFGPPSWHPSSHALLFTAEAPKPKTESLPQQSTYKYTPDFGETFTGKKFPCTFLFLLPSSPFRNAVSSTSDLPSKPSVHRLMNAEHFPSTNFGQPVFLPDNVDGTPRILATGYSSLGDTRKLGIVYCANRPAQIYEFSISIVPLDPSSPAKLTYRVLTATSQSDPTRSSRSPRVLHPPPNAPFAPLIVFLSNPVGGPHSSCASLHAVALQKDGGAKTVELVASVEKPKNLEDFPGLYVDQLPQSAFVLTEEGPGVVLSSIWRSRKVPLLVSLRTGEVTSLAPWPEANEEDVVLPYLGKGLESVNVLGTDGGGRVVAMRSGVVQIPEVVLLDLKKGGERDWKVIKAPSLPKKLANALSSLSYTVLPLPKFDASELILVSPCPIDPSAPAKPNLPPLITFPHGGPHSTTTTEWSAYTACLALAGYRVALVNYPGSLGYGQQFVDSLPPQLGTLEVEATLAAGHYLNTLSLASRTKGKKFVLGGSHGGWIAAHLSARFPDEFDATVMRNPVTDLASNSFNTDIPDWCYAEGALPYSLSHPPTAISPETFTHLRSISPLSHASHVTLPTLLLIGASDRRVPPDQGRTWYHALKGCKKSEVEMLVFEGNGHALDGTVEAEVVGFEAGLRWFERFTEW